ncbi:MAG: hypothetical protein ABFD63_02100 [Smithella sp.]|jgi:hypothetical protein
MYVIKLCRDTCEADVAWEITLIANISRKPVVKLHPERILVKRGSVYTIATQRLAA